MSLLDNHYLATVSVTDAKMHDSSSTVTNTFDIAVLAANNTEAISIITAFYSTSGFSAKTVNNVHTLFRSTSPNTPGAIRQVKVLSLSLITPTGVTDNSTVTTETPEVAVPIISSDEVSTSIPPAKSVPRSPGRKKVLQIDPPSTQGESSN